MAVVTVCSDFGAQEHKMCHCFNFLSFYLPLSNGSRCHDLSVLNVEFQASFFTLFFHPHQRGSLVPLHFLPRVASSAYLRLLILLLEVLILPCNSSSLALHMIYSEYKLNKQGDNIQPFPIWSQSVVPCQVQTVASWPAYRFFRRQISWSGISISLRIFHSLLWSS